MKEQLINYIKLARLHKPFAILLVFLPCLWGFILAYKQYGASVNLINKYFFILVLGSTFARSFGCIINDIFDHKFDSNTQRTKIRPLANGTVTKTQAIFLAALFALLSLGLLFFLPIKAVMSCLISVPLIIVYPLTKRFFHFPQLFLGIVFNIGVFVGFFCLAKAINIQVVLLYIVAVLWTVFYDTIYAMQDVEDDIKNNLKSLPVFIGLTKNGIFNKNKVYNFLVVINAIIFLGMLLFGYAVSASQYFYGFLYLATILNIFLLKCFNGKLEYQQSFNLSIVFGVCISCAIYLC